MNSFRIYCSVFGKDQNTYCKHVLVSMAQVAYMLYMKKIVFSFFDKEESVEAERVNVLISMCPFPIFTIMI